VTDPLEELREAARARSRRGGRDRRPRARRTRRGAPRPVGHPIPVGRLRSRTCGSRRASSRPPNGSSRSSSGCGRRRAALGVVLGPVAAGRPVRADGRVRAPRWPRGRALERSVRRDDATVRPGRPGVRGLGARAADRVRDARHVPPASEDLGAWASAFAYLAWGLSGNWDRELLRVRLVERKGPDAVESLLPPLPAIRPSWRRHRSPAGCSTGCRGRRARVQRVGGRRFAHGERCAAAANDPHLLVQAAAAVVRDPPARARGTRRAAWRSRSRRGSSAGTTAHHAWGITNVSGDVQDLYVERLNEDGRRRVRRRVGAPHDGRNGSTCAAATGRIEVRETRHGPLLDHRAGRAAGATSSCRSKARFALRWTPPDGLLEPAALIDIVRAGSFEAFREASCAACPARPERRVRGRRRDDRPAVHGSVSDPAFRRRRGSGGRLVADHEWDGYVPFEELPWSANPGSGVPRGRQQPDPRRGLPAPDRTGRARAVSGARRIAERLEAVDPVTRRRVRLDPGSTRYLPRERAPPAPARSRVPPPTGHGTRSNDSGRGTATWPPTRARPPSTGVARRDRGGGARRGRRPGDVRGVLRGARGVRLLRAPGDARRAGSRLRTAGAGAICWARRWRRRSTGWSRSSAPTRPRGDGARSTGTVRAPARAPSGSRRHVRGRRARGRRGRADRPAVGPGRQARVSTPCRASWRQVVDLSNVDATRAVLSTGQSGNPASPHWNDQSPLWAAGELRPCPLTARGRGGGRAPALLWSRVTSSAPCRSPDSARRRPRRGLRATAHQGQAQAEPSLVRHSSCSA
jgi:penicillin amidase